MSPYVEKYKKNIAIEMRKKGLSYTDIENQIHVPRSTLSFWLKKIKLTDEQKKKINDKKIQALKKGSEKKIARTRQTIEEIKRTSAKDIKEIKKKELWLIGVVLYWRERFLSGNESDLRKGVRFTSSDPYLIKLFLKWLQDVGQIKNEEIDFDIFMTDNQRSSKKEVIAYWSDVIGIPEDKFTRIYFQKTKKFARRLLAGRQGSGGKTKGRIIKNKTRLGLLRIRVKASSMLARQISGWVRGIIKYYWD